MQEKTLFKVNLALSIVLAVVVTLNIALTWHIHRADREMIDQLKEQNRLMTINAQCIGRQLMEKEVTCGNLSAPTPIPEVHHGK